MQIQNSKSKYHKALHEFRVYLVTEELKQHNGNICRAALSLGIHRNTLNRIIAETGINVYKIKETLNGARERAAS
jgi:DNA-binding NtrC family response regulator